MDDQNTRPEVSCCLLLLCRAVEDLNEVAGGLSNSHSEGGSGAARDQHIQAIRVVQRVIHL